MLHFTFIHVVRSLALGRHKADISTYKTYKQLLNEVFVIVIKADVSG